MTLDDLVDRWMRWDAQTPGMDAESAVRQAAGEQGVTE